jgi:hypothetical protein
MPTTNIAPSLRLLVPSGSLRRFQLIQLHQIVPFLRGANHSILSGSWFAATCWTSRLLASRTLVRKSSRRSHYRYHTFQPWLLSSVLPSDTLLCFPPCSYVWRLLNISAPYDVVAFQALPKSLPERPSFLGFLFNIVPSPIFPDEFSLAPCHSYTAGNLAAGDDQFLSRPTIPMGPFLQLTPRSEVTFRFLIAPAVFTADSSPGTLWCSTPDLIVSGCGTLHWGVTIVIGSQCARGNPHVSTCSRWVAFKAFTGTSWRSWTKVLAM